MLAQPIRWFLTVGSALGRLLLAIVIAVSLIGLAGGIE
jgi:hypothetical protein